MQNAKCELQNDSVMRFTREKIFASRNSTTKIHDAMSLIIKTIKSIAGKNILI